MRPRVLGPLAFALTLFAAAPVAAQKPAPYRATLPTTPAAPVVDFRGTPAGTFELTERAAETGAPAEPQRTRARRRAPGVTLMLVGLAGVVTGLVIDESVITVPSAAVGLFGLYLYLR